MIKYLVDSLIKTEDFKKIIECVQEKGSSAYLHGIVSEALGHFCYALKESNDGPLLLITEEELRAKSIYESLSDLPNLKVLHYPKREISFHNIKALEDSGERARIEVMNSLTRGEKPIIIASCDALVNKISTKAFFVKSTIKVDLSTEIEIDDLAKKLSHLQYERVDTVEDKGQFAIRGGIVDIYPIDYDNPIRLELFDTEIDSMRTFSVENQRSIENIEEFTVSPAREFLLTEKDKGNIIAGLEKDINKIETSYSYGIDKEHLIEKYSSINQYIKDDLILKNPDLVMQYIKPNSYSSIIDYLEEKSLIVMEDVARIYDRAANLNISFLETVTYNVEKSEGFESHQGIIYKFAQILEKIKNYSSVNITQIKKKTRIFDSKISIGISAVETMTYNRNFTMLAKQLEDYLYRGYKIIIMAQNEDKARSIINILASEDIPSSFAENGDETIKSSQILVTPYSFSKGFEYKLAKFVIITQNEIYGKSKRAVKNKNKKKLSSKDIISYSDLTVGDFVVHENHGIGVYKGLENIEVQGKSKDYLVLEYRGTDKLFVPIDQMDMIQKYIGAEAKAPKLSKLGSADWTKTKTKTKKVLEEIAEDLVKLYAKRSQEKGYAFSKDQQWQREFEDSFIYEETGAQIRSIDEIKKDMEKDRPMERLLCGDVGFGKTEVAFRAAFKAVMDSKQVAILVPTTILAQQHYNTAVERFKNFPIKVDMISRFRSPLEQKRIASEVEKGFVDIVIGTHRILSKDLAFKDLGLLIIDEEQRFGVRHKEKLKLLKANIDVLTLSATPIPRTLQMGLVGVRDMSVLDEAPEERYPTTTYVLEYDDTIIREAIIREISRDGQVYFVYNRVKDIEMMAERLSNLVPEARIVIGHGQMSERALENVMIDFENGEYDILLCTSIIETGMDIHNVNTMIIYNADYMGLSQLYQLKGRVGRADRSSFAYFTYERGKGLSEISEKRLKAIRDFTELGSGFKIAMRDLELRGAGNMLGESQHGHIDSVGYDLYVKFMSEAIRKAKGEVQQSPDREIDIDIDMDSYMPNNYIKTNQDKVEIYKRIAMIQDREDYDDMVFEMIDRFGDIPEPVMNVISVSLLKNLARKNGITAIKGREGYLELYYENANRFGPDDFKVMLDLLGDNLEIKLGEISSFRIKEEKDKIFKAVALIEAIEKKAKKD